MSNRSAARGTAAASSIRLTLRTSNAVATSNASPSRCFLFCEGSRAARSARTAAATVSTPPIPKAPPNQRRRPPNHQASRVQELLMGGEVGRLSFTAPDASSGSMVRLTPFLCQAQGATLHRSRLDPFRFDLRHRLEHLVFLGGFQRSASVLLSTPWGVV